MQWEFGSLTARTLPILVLGLLVLVLTGRQLQAQPVEVVAWAGVSYFTAAQDIAIRYPTIHRLEQRARDMGRPWDRDVVNVAALHAPPGVNISTNLNPESGIALMLVFTGERLETTRVTEGAWKQVFGVSGSVLFVHAATRQIRTAIPVSYLFIRSSRSRMSEEEIDAWLIPIFDPDSASSVFGLSLSLMPDAVVEENISRCSVQVSSIEYQDESLSQVQLGLGGIWTDVWNEVIAGELSMTWARQSPLITLPPFTTVAVDGRMPTRFSDGRVYNVQIPEPDYVLQLQGVRVAEAPYGASAAGSSRVFGSWGQMRLVEPLSGNAVFEVPLAEALVRRISATSSMNDEELPELSVLESLRSMLNGGVTALFTSDEKWFEDRRIDAGVQAQFASLRNTLGRCT